MTDLTENRERMHPVESTEPRQLSSMTFGQQLVPCKTRAHTARGTMLNVGPYCTWHYTGVGPCGMCYSAFRGSQCMAHVNAYRVIQHPWHYTQGATHMALTQHRGHHTWHYTRGTTHGPPADVIRVLLTSCVDRCNAMIKMC